MRSTSCLPQATREAPRHRWYVCHFMSLSPSNPVVCLGIQNLGFVGSCTETELILASFNPLTFSKLLFRPSLVFTEPLPQLVLRTINRTIESLEPVSQSCHKRPGRQHRSKRDIFRHHIHSDWCRECFCERRKQRSGEPLGSPIPVQMVTTPHWPDHCSSL